MQKFVLLIASRGVAALIATLVCASVAAQTPTLKIGFVTELSGAQAANGQDQLDGFMLAVERLGGKLGGVPVEVLAEDTKLRPEVAVQAVQKLIEKDHVPIIVGVGFSNTLMAVHKQVTQKEVVLIGTLGGPSAVAGALCSPYQFFTSAQNDTLAEAMGKFAGDKGFKRITLLAPNYQAGKDYIAGFKRTFKGAIVEEIYTQLNQLDYSAELAQVALAKPDAVFVFYPGPLGIAFIRQYQQAGLSGRIPLLSVGAIDANTLGGLKQAALGVFGASAWSPDLDNAANRQFVAQFEKKYGRVPGVPAAYSYDAAMLIDSAVRKVGGNIADKPALLVALKSASFTSLRGRFSFGNNNFPINDMLVQEVVKDGAGVAQRTVAVPMTQYADSFHAQCAMK